MSIYNAGLGVSRRGGAALILVGLAASLAAGADVRAFPASGVDLDTYKTFKLLPPKLMTKAGLKENEPPAGPLIAAALRKELVGKGLTEVTTGADLEVSSLGTAVSIPQIEALIYSNTLTGSAITGTAPTRTLGRYNKEGTLYVNLIDARANKSAWLGISTRALGKPASLENDINKAAQAMFKKYPAIK
jgi:uncharacterized protein DUF4136